MMEEKSLPLVTVVIPCYNHEKYVKECIQSVINQDYVNIELMIINDGSKDNSHEVIMSLVEECKGRFKRFEYINRENKGLSATLNEMVNWSNGKYFSAIASDDILITNKISLLVEKLENLDENYAAAFGDATFIDDKSNEVYIDYKTGEYSTKEKGGKSFLDYYTLKRDFDYKDESAFGSYKTLLGGNYLPAMSAVIKLKQIKEVDAWTSGNRLEDTEMWLKLARNYKFYCVDSVVALYRWHDLNSMKTIHSELLFDLTKILKSEKNYADNIGNSDFDSSYYYSLLARNLFLTNCSIKSKISLIDISEMPQLCNFIIKKLLRKVINK